MSQVSSAVAYLHEKGLCLRGVNVENVVLMSEILADPIAKLSRLSTCCQGVSSQRATVEEVKLEFKDVNDLGHLLHSLITSGYRDLMNDELDAEKKAFTEESEEKRRAGWC